MKYDEHFKDIKGCFFFVLTGLHLRLCVCGFGGASAESWYFATVMLGRLQFSLFVGPEGSLGSTLLLAEKSSA